MKIKLESYNESTFLWGGLAFEKGAYVVKYQTFEGTDDNGLFTTTGQNQTLIWIAPKADAQASGNNQKLSLPTSGATAWTNFLDSNGDPYASFDETVKAIVALIAAPNSASVNDLISDKAQVTQATSKTTSVISNTLSTTITTVSLTDAADAAFSFTFTNSKISATSIVLPTVSMGSSTGKALVTVVPGSGSAVVTVTNVGTAAFNNAIKIGLVVI